MSKEAIEHYEAALKEAFQSGASGDVFHHWNEARKALAEQPAPVQYQRREIGEGDWMDCTKEQYEKAMALPEWDTRVIPPQSQPAQPQEPTATELSNGLAMALHDAVLIRVGGNDEATRQACARIDKLVDKYRAKENA